MSGLVAALGLVVTFVGGCGIGPDSPAASRPETAVGEAPPGEADTGDATDPSSPQAEQETDRAPVRTGAGVLVDNGFERLDGLRVGVILNRASLVGGQLLLDVLDAAPSVELVAAFAPEHGLRAEAAAGESVDDEVDEATGVPVHSLYGADRAPQPEALADLDALLFDLQDVGSRTYTYISTMGLAMRAAADAGVTFIVGDRPNPLGGTYLAGHERDPAFDSFVGQYPIPTAHGMTTGELALAIHGERWLDGLDGLDLEVVALDGWRRTDRWDDTGLPWLAPSPALPTVAASAAYPGTVLFEATPLSVGRGTAEPFTTLGAPWVDPVAATAELNSRGLPGVTFEPLTFTPEPAPGTGDASDLPFAGQEVRGVRLAVTDPAAFDPVATGVHLLEVLGVQAAAAGVSLIDRPDTFDLLAGTDELRLGLTAAVPPTDLVAAWADDVAAFEQLRQPYLLYD